MDEVPAKIQTIFRDVVTDLKNKVEGLAQAPALVSGLHGPDRDLSLESAEWAQGDNYKEQMKVKAEFRQTRGKMKKFNILVKEALGAEYGIDSHLSNMEAIYKIGIKKGWAKAFTNGPLGGGGIRSNKSKRRLYKKRKTKKRKTKRHK
jgi:hypothetical protein